MEEVVHHVCTDLRCLAAKQYSPFSSLPIEVISAIFEIGSQLAPLSDSEVPFRFAVSQVCCHWRLIAFDTARLWSRINVTSKMPLDVIALYLQRSRLHKLDVRINFRSVREHQMGDVSRILDLLVAHAHRWCHLSVISCSSLALEITRVTLGSVDVPCLTSFHLAQIGKPESYYFAMTIFNTPALTALRLDGITWDINRFQLSGITSLHLEEYRANGRHLSASEVFNILKVMPMLKHLALLGSVFAFWHVPDYDTPLVLSSLHYLRLSDTQFSLLFLQAVSAPTLHSLVLEHVSVLQVADFTDIKHTHEYSNLRSLTLIDVCLNTTSYVKLFRAFNRITHLAVIDSDPDPMLPLLKPTFSPLLSDLKTLAFSSPSPSRSSSSASARLLCSVVRDRSTKGRRPPPDLYLGHALMAELRAAGKSEWLADRVKVGELRENDVVAMMWPPAIAE